MVRATCRGCALASSAAVSRTHSLRDCSVLTLLPVYPTAHRSTGTYSARLVLHSILARLSLAQSAFNVLSEANFTQALADAERADKHLADTGAPLGRLHGLPISLKDSVNVAGLDTTLGLCRFANQPAAADALIVQLLKKQGALIHAKSNIPQTLLSFECVNPLHGRTLNPFNKKSAAEHTTHSTGSGSLATQPQCASHTAHLSHSCSPFSHL